MLVIRTARRISRPPLTFLPSRASLPARRSSSRVPPPSSIVRFVVSTRVKKSTLAVQSDLKKEIKKLQRFRDQVKQWAGSNDVKDKNPLLEARRRIEVEMERFKVIEKETETKAFSKEGLAAARVAKDPKEKAKDEAKEWINNAI